MAKRKKKAEAFDERDEAIIHCIEQDPSILLKKIPSAVENRGFGRIPYPTVQRRVNEMIKNGIVERQFSINWTKAGYLVRYRVGIQINPAAFRDEPLTTRDYATQKDLADFIMNKLAHSKDFKNKLVVDDVHILLGGPVDLSIDFFAKDDKTATQFIIDALRRQPGISDTESAKLAYSSKEGWLSRDDDE